MLVQERFAASEDYISATIRDDFKEVDQADEVTPGAEVTPIYGNDTETTLLAPQKGCDFSNLSQLPI